MIKFISWNVNGIRAAIKKGFRDFVNEYESSYGIKPQPHAWAIDVYPLDWVNFHEKRTTYITLGVRIVGIQKETQIKLEVFFTVRKVICCINVTIVV